MASLGPLEQLALLALVRLGGEAHSAAVGRELEDRTGQRVSPGALYTVLERMGEKGYLHSWIGEATPERGGNRRKCYRILPEGARGLRAWQTRVAAMDDGTATRLQKLAEEAL